MSDLWLQTGISRDEVADVLRENPEHATYVLARLGNETDASELEEFFDSATEDGCDMQKIAAFYRAVANAAEKAA